MTVVYNARLCPLLESPDIALPHPHPPGSDPVAEKIDAIADRKNLLFLFVQHEPDAPKVLADGFAETSQLLFAWAEKEKIIDIPYVRNALERLDDEVVQSVQVDIRKKLAGEIPDWNPPPPKAVEKRHTSRPVVVGFAAA